MYACQLHDYSAPGALFSIKRQFGDIGQVGKSKVQTLVNDLSGRQLENVLLTADLD